MCTLPSFDFETDATGSCPQGWTCTGSASVQSKATAGCLVSGVTGSHYFSVACDTQTGSAVSSTFFLPPNVATMRFQRQGGADSPSGLYVYSAATDALIAQSNDGRDTDTMFEITLSLLAHAGEKVYIEVKDQTSGGWGKVGYDAFRFYDAQHHVKGGRGLCGRRGSGGGSSGGGGSSSGGGDGSTAVRVVVVAVMGSGSSSGSSGGGSGGGSGSGSRSGYGRGGRV